MAGMYLIYSLGVIILSFLLTGVSEAEVTRVFSSSGEDVSLPCNNVHSGCTSTTWNYNSHRTSSAVELFAGGIKKNDIERYERLSLGSDCSLIIYKATVKDYGQYNCQQFVNGHKHENDACVFLHVLQVSVSPSSTQTEFRPGSFVTLICQLYSYEPCDHLVRFEGLQLVWVNQADVNLQTDSRYQISPGNCISTLTTRLLNEDNNTELRCLVKNKHVIKISDSYTVKIKAPVDTTTPVTPDISTSFEDLSTPITSNIPTSQVIVISALVAVLAVFLPAVLWVVCKKRADNRKGTDSSVVKNENENKETYETINISIPSAPSTNEQNYDVTYCEVTAYSKQQITKANVHRDDEVTYAAIKGEEFASHTE